MRVMIYPADELGCGKIRLIWPAEILAAAGHDVTVEDAEHRRFHMHQNEAGVIDDVEIDDGVDVIIFQRPSHALLAQAIPIIRSKGVAVVVDVDDDMSHIHPENAAWLFVHPDRAKQELIMQGWRNQPGMPRLNQMAANMGASRQYLHSYKNLEIACREATLVTCSTPRLQRVYAAHGRGRVLYNCLAEHYYGHDRTDSPNVVWPASIHSHPNDPPVVGNGLARALRETGVSFTFFGEPVLERGFGPDKSTVTVGSRFNLPFEPTPGGIIDLPEWPRTLAGMGIAVIPLADTTFNYSKSWLKGQECNAAGLPWIASPRVEYRRLHDLGCGVLADSPVEWYRALRNLIRSESMRAELSEAGRAVAEQWRLRDNAWLWWEAWSDALAIQRGDHAAKAAAG